MEKLYEHTLRKQAAEIEKLKSQNDEMNVRQNEMQSMLHQLMSQRETTSRHHAQIGEVMAQAGDHSQISQQTDNRKQHIVINLFGQESLDHVTAARIRAILTDSLSRPALPEAAQTAVLKTAMLVYSDPDHPENLTAYLPNKKADEVLVHAKEGWEIQPASLILPPMALKSVDTLFDNQPFENADEYGPLMKELAENEKRYTAGTELRPILVRNKDLLARVLETLPVAGCPADFNTKKKGNDVPGTSAHGGPAGRAKIKRSNLLPSKP